MRTHREELTEALVPAVSLATVGVLVTAGIVGVFAHIVLGVSLELGLPIGAIVGSTDAASVFSILGRKPFRRSLKRTLEVESGPNDPMVIFSDRFPPGLQPSSRHVRCRRHVPLRPPAGPHGDFSGGVIFAGLTRRGRRRIRFEASGLYPLLLVGVLMAYGLSSVSGGRK